MNLQVKVFIWVIILGIFVAFGLWSGRGEFFSETGERVTITTDKTEYLYGEPIIFKIYNEGPSSMYLYPISSQIETLYKDGWGPMFSFLGTPIDFFPEFKGRDFGKLFMEILPNRDYSLIIDSQQLYSEGGRQRRFRVRYLFSKIAPYTYDEIAIDIIIYSNEFIVKSK